MTPCHACPSPAGPSGWCTTHRNRLNARASGLLDHMALTDQIAIAAHPGWRGHKWRLVPRMWEDGLFFHADAQDGIGPGYKTAAEALYDVDFRNGIPVATEIDLRKRLAEVERERDALEVQLAHVRAHRDEVEREATDQRHRAEAAEDALTDIATIARGEMADPFHGEGAPDTIAGRAYDAVCRLVRERDDALKRVEESVATYRHASGTADYMRERLLPALDAAGIRYDDPPEALRLWIVRQEEAIDRQSSDIAGLSADLAAARSDADTLRARLDRYRAAVAALAVAVVLVVVAAVGGGL